ncbi:Sec-independent protein translocase subunit TatA [Pseudonocardia nigra]|uniref:Sec-independent protein translocase subunit TatA n=1 Tax=Pseudonocardia nigra TaxID=1921578 RepID=UPI001C5F44A9|nr:Sec-independent protein translocase subunit TatA [Pseudonocardia nigra]
MPSLGGWEFVILIGILVLLFGAKRLPDMARSIGQSARVFKGEMKGMKGDDESAGTTDKSAATPPAAPPAALPPTSTQAQDPQPEPTRATQQGHSSSAQ